MKRSAVPLDLEHRTAYRFAVLSAMSTRCIADLYRRHGLTVSGWRTLSLIGHHEPIHPGGIAERTSVDPDKVTRAVDRLVHRKLVERALDRTDRRRIVLTLTRRGRKVHDEIDHVRRVMEKEFLSVLSADELRRFNASLDKLETQARRIFRNKKTRQEILRISRK